MATPPIPKARTIIPNVDSVKRPVPSPRKRETDKDEPRSTSKFHTIYDEPVPLRRVEGPSLRTEFVDKIQEGKRISTHFASTTRDKIERGVSNVANFVGQVINQGVPNRRSGIRSEYPIPGPANTPPPRPVSIPPDMAMDLFGTIQFGPVEINQQKKVENKEFHNEEKKGVMPPETVTSDARSSSENLYANESLPIIRNSSFNTFPATSYTQTITEMNSDSNTGVYEKEVTIDENLKKNKSSSEYDNQEIYQSSVEDSQSIYEAISIPSESNVIQSPILTKSENPFTLKQPTVHRDILQPVTLHSRKISSSEKNGNKPTSSTLFEFDPLKPNYVVQSKNANMTLFDTLFDDTKPIATKEIDDDVSDDVDYGIYLDNAECFMPPPMPPERIDSLTESFYQLNSSAKIVESLTLDSDHSQNNVNHSNACKEPIKRTLTTKIADILPFRRSESRPNHNHSKVEKPPLSNAPVQHRGLMTRLLAGPIDELLKNFQMRLCVLANQTLTYHQDNTVNNVKETYSMDNLHSIQTIFSNNLQSNITLYCFQMNFHNPGGFSINRNSIVFGCNSKAERCNWILKIVESLTTTFPLKLISDMTRFGWCFIKENVSRPWESGWLLLCRRDLYYHTVQDKSIQILDLRKARCVVLQNDDETNLVNAEEGPNLILDFHDKTLYIKMGSSQETKVWKKIIYTVASSNGSWIYHQQLTRDDIPTMVNKCINFIYSQGSLSEGIYRKTGSVSEVKLILDAFKKDAWAVQLSQRTHNEHDIASVLKQFFRDLPEPVLAPSIHSDLFSVTKFEKKNEKVKAYQELLKMLNPVSQNTLRKLLGHLHFIQTLSEENKMTSENLAAIWGPSLMAIRENGDGQKSFFMEAHVIKDLIDMYIPIYNPSSGELERDKLMLGILHKVQKNSMTIPVKPSGDFHIWIYLGTKSSENSINIVLSPGKTAKELCLDQYKQMRIPAHDLVVEEFICGESMYRPIHYSEVLLDIVFRWGYWDEADRKDNYLIIRENTLVKEAIGAVEPPIGQQYFIGDLKFASEKSKNFKTYTFHFNDHKLLYFKDKFGNALINSWKIEDIFWYIGHEPKRNPQTKWSLTFIQRNKTTRSREKQWFGSTIAGAERGDMIRLMGMFMKSQYSGNVLPEVQLVSL